MACAISDMWKGTTSSWSVGLLRGGWSAPRDHPRAGFDQGRCHRDDWHPIDASRKGSDEKLPIVMVGVGDPVKEGLIESLARPGGNITGLAALTGLENVVKRIELLKDLLPGLSRVAVLLSKGETAAGWEQISEVES